MSTSPTSALARSTDLLIRRSPAGPTLVLAVERLSAGSGSSTELVTRAVLSTGLSAADVSTVAARVTVALAPLASVPIAQITCAPLTEHVPCEAVRSCSVVPVGRSSVTTTPVAALGPSFVATIVHVSVSPTLAVARSTDLAIRRSAAAFTVVVTLERLFAVSGSSSLPATVAALVSGDPAEASCTVPVSVMVIELPLGRLPVRAQLTTCRVVLHVVPAGAVGVPRVTPAGAVSVSTTPVAALGPSFVAVTVQVIVSPTSAAPRSAVLVMRRSVAGPLLVAAVAELFGAVGVELRGRGAGEVAEGSPRPRSRAP